MILDEIAEKTRERVAAAKQQISLEEMKEKAESMNVETGFPFEKALRDANDIAFICEVKKASPSKGLIASDFPYRQIAIDYEKAGASAISVLTEPYWFKGENRYLTEIAEAVSIPVLRKDFTVDEYMIYEAKVIGASAVLLICAILNTETIRRYINISDSLGLSAIVEAHDAEEVKSALEAGARIIGVNNRNLKDFTVDINNSSRYRTMVPEDIIFISESGIKTAEDVDVLRKNGTNAVLIGETLMRSENKKAEIDKLRGVKEKKMSKGRFGDFGGQYIPETLMNEIINLEESYEKYSKDPEFVQELDTLLREYAGRPSLLYYAEKMTKDLGGAKIYLKREDLNHTGSHKINNVLGQVLLAKKMGKTRVIAETGAGQHGVATATAAALLDMECEIFMGKEDTERQALNVYRMELLGAKVNAVTTGTMTLKDAVNEAMREWSNRVDDTLYVLGSVMGPHPFPTIVRDFQSVISKEAREQILEKEGKLPAAVVACVGGGSNSMGMFYNFINDKDVKLIGCEAAGKGVDTELHAATIAKGSLGVFHGMKSYFCQDEYGQIAPVYSISAGLDYPGIGPEHAYLHDTGRAQYVPIKDDEAVEAFEYLARTEGIICAIESAHAVAHVMKIAPKMDKEDIIIVCLSGRGDKDVAAIARYRGVDLVE